jgi:tRNA threonylcarbamoyladenosine biosynthesis protein TsaB
MKLLAIETSGSACSAALVCDGVISERIEDAPRRHAELILAMMDALLRERGLVVADLDALAFGRGPGSFTGLRIATAVIQGAAFAADLPVVGVSTLATLAQGCLRVHETGQVLCAFDARMGELYWGVYQADDAGLMRPLFDDSVCAPEDIALPSMQAAWFGAGSGWSLYREQLMRRLGSRLGDAVTGIDAEGVCQARDILPLAADAYRRGETVCATRALPVYLRNQVATVKTGG